MKLKERIRNFFGSVRRFFRRLWNGRFVISDLIKHKHRFVVTDVDTYKEKLSFQLSGGNLFVFLGITALVLVFLTSILLAFTPLRELIPGYTNSRMVEQTFTNARVVDSLEHQVALQEQMLADIQDVMAGRDPGSRHTSERVGSDSLSGEPSPYVRSAADSMLRAEVESIGGDKNYARPLKGKITKRFNPKGGFYGVNIEGSVGDDVVSVRDGQILVADKGSDGMLTIIIMHSGGLVSMYKTHGTLKAKVGDEVMAGEPVMTLKAGTKNSKTVLYIELRSEGDALNPEECF